MTLSSLDHSHRFRVRGEICADHNYLIPEPSGRATVVVTVKQVVDEVKPMAFVCGKNSKCSRCDSPRYQL